MSLELPYPPDTQILLKNCKNASTRLSTNGKSPMILTTAPFVLRLSKDERRFFSRIILRGLAFSHYFTKNWSFSLVFGDIASI